MEVEHVLGGSEYEDFESSSSENHSSPSTNSDSAYSATSHPEWALDLGLSIPTLHHSNWAHPSPFKAVPSSMHTSTSNFWNQPDHFEQPREEEQQHKNLQNDTDSLAFEGGIEGQGRKGEQDDTSLQLGNGSRRSMEMEFDDMINEDSCGPSTGNSPLSLHSHSPTMPARQHPVSYSHISMPAVAESPPPQPHSYLASAGLALQLPPPSSFPSLGSTGGIAPSLTGGQPTPPLGSPITNLLPDIPASPPAESSKPASPLPSTATEDDSNPPPPPPPSSSTRPTRERRTSARASGLVRSATHSASSSRERVSASQTNSTLPADSSSSAIVVPGTGVNLVSREAVQVTQLIPNQSNPPPSALTGSGASSSAYTPPVKLLVLGVPTVGAKSRVETQIKISLSLVRPLGGIKREGNSSSEWAENLINEEGSIDSNIASDELERIGSWSHIRIPKYLALKSRTKEDGKPTVGKKSVNPGPPPPPENTLVLDVAVVRASDPSSQIFICTNCRARELKRSLRKKDPKGKSAPPPAPPVEDLGDKDEEEEKRKVVVFNSPEFVEFGTGECVLPTRVTCYCRHHKEKKGFCVTYSLRDHLDNIVASGMTPPIMITDDHKTSVAKNAQAAAAASSSAPLSASTAIDSKRKAPAKVAPPSASIGKKEKTNGTTSTTTSRSRRAGGRSRRGASESTDATGGEEEVEPASKKSKPYDVEARPKKRQSPASRHSPAFAMTPLHSAPGSGFVPPAPPPSTVNSTVSTPASSHRATYGQSQQPQNSRATSPAASHHSTQSSFASALGLDGINHSANLPGGDAVMTDSTPSTVQSPTFIPPASFSPRHSVSTEASLPPQHQSHNLFDWRSNGANSTISTPPLSPGATTPSVHNENFNSLFGSFPSPVDSIQQQQQSHLHQSVPPVSSIPSFAIPATEPLESLTSTWAFQQALQQQQQEIAASMPPPRINRLIPGEGPVSGGIEVTILGENFVRDLTCLFGDSGAVSTHFWSTNTLVCVLPPSANPGPVFVGIKGVLHNPEQGGLPLFTYKDNSDRNLLELALQVVGLKMTGRLEDASAVAMRIVGNSPQGGGGGSGGGNGSHQVNGGAQDTATLAATLNAAATSAYATPVPSRPSSRRTSFSTNSPSSSTTPVLAPAETRNFEGIVIKFLSLLDLDPSLLPGAAPSLPSASPPISQPDAQQHTLLHLATVLGFHRLVAFLLARGIDYDAADRNGYTALHFAALYGRVAIARHLLDAGANASLKTFAGRTAIEIAQERDDVDVEDLLLRAAPSPSSTTLEQITPRISSRRPLVSFSPASLSRPTSLYGDSDDEGQDQDSFDDQVSEIDGSSEEGEQSDWSRSDRSFDESSDWPSESDEDGDEGADEAEEEEVYTRPARSRNASTISLHYLLEAEENAQMSTPVVKKVSFPDSEVDESPAPPSKPSLSASSSSSWLSKKLKPTVQPGLDKLQPLTGGVSNAWEKAKANRFNLPQMHMPELGAFPAMPAALTRRMSTSRRRSGGATSAGEETDAGEESGWEGASRHWRALYSGQWWNKTPSSPPPQYTPSDSLYLPNTTDPDEKLATSTNEFSPSTSASTSIARPSQFSKLSRRSRRKLSVVSDDTDDTASVAASEFEEIKHDGNDRMLWFFWIPVLLFVLTFAYLNFQVYLTPVIETLADTILPQPLANLLT
ncbi:hypothetical protein JCM5350_000013 [Sporobolomyces pararoseus]